MDYSTTNVNAEGSRCPVKLKFLLQSGSERVEHKIRRNISTLSCAVLSLMTLRGDKKILMLGLLSEELLQLRAEIFPRSKDVFPHWNGLCVGNSTADFRQSNELAIQPGEN